MPQLDPTWFASQIFWLFACFALLYVLLARIVLPPLSGTIQRRAHTISSDIGAAEKAKHSAERARKDYETTLAQSREMAQALINEVLLENKVHAEKTLQKMDIEIAKKVDEAHRRIVNKKHELLAALTPATAEFAGQIAEKIVASPVNKEQASHIVIDLLKTRNME